MKCHTLTLTLSLKGEGILLQVHEMNVPCCSRSTAPLP